jgi:biotin/methionine sulfoxide reductase
MTVHLAHWGTFEAVSDGERLTEVRPWRGDPEPMPLIGNVASAQHHPARITQPHVRKGWLDHGPGAPGRGDEPFVPVSWDTALDLLSGNCGGSTASTGPKRCTAAPTAGPARAGSTTRRARCTGS